MIHSIERLGTEENNEGCFLINGKVKVKYIEENNDISMDLEFNEDEISENEAFELGQELLRETLKSMENL